MTPGTHMQDHGEFVLYCAECDGLFVQEIKGAFIFKNEAGPFVMLYEKNGLFKMHDFYIVGNL